MGYEALCRSVPALFCGTLFVLVCEVSTAGVIISADIKGARCVVYPAPLLWQLCRLWELQHTYIYTSALGILLLCTCVCGLLRRVWHDYTEVHISSV